MNITNRLFSFVDSLPASDRIVLKFLIALTTAAVLFAAASVSIHNTVSIPGRGGSLNEGVVGTPRFINPLLAVTPADKDMATLVYAGLMRLSADGSLIPDLADSITVSDDGLTYNIVLRQNAYFHDGTPVTADDALFTIARIQDPNLKSPLRVNWDGATTERIGDHEFNIVLTQAYSPFIENLTVGILPRHIWENLSTEELPFSQHNTEPIGAGPYMIINVTLTKSGIPKMYSLAPWEKYHGSTPFIANLFLTFFPNEAQLVDALIAGTIDSAASLSPYAIDQLFADTGTPNAYTLYRTPLPRTFAVFFNQNENPLFRDKSVRKALDVAIDRAHIVETVLDGYGQPIDGPLPPGFGFDNIYTPITEDRIELAKKILRDGGWKLNEETGLWEKKDKESTQELKFSLSTANTPAFEGTAEELRTTWSKIGIPVDVKKFEQSDLTQAVMRPRKYEALLFGTALGRELDLYSFWHSSQRLDPGLNVALYASISADDALTTTRKQVSEDERHAAYMEFAANMREELPALFLYVPEFVYIVPHSLNQLSFTKLSWAQERWSDIGSWYRETENVWPFIASQRSLRNQ